MIAAALRCAAAIRRVGGEAVLVRGEERLLFPASLQPRVADAADYADELGVGSVYFYTLYAPWDSGGSLLEAGDCVEWMGSRYYVQRTEIYTVSGEPIYRWAVVCRESGEG